MTVLTVEKELQHPDLNELLAFGKFHKLQFFWICLPLFMISMLHVNYVFIAEVPKYRCAVPECDGSNATIDTPSWWPAEVDAQCQRPLMAEEVLAFNSTRENETCSADSFAGVAECKDWIYDSHESIVTSFNLGCNSWQASLVGTLHNAGMVLSMPVAGWLSDKIGRKPTVIFCSIGGFIGLFKIFVTNFYAYVGIEFLESMIASGLYNVGIIQFVEIGGESKRLTSGVIFSYAVYVGEVAYAIMAMVLRYWKYIIIAIYAPMILFVSYFHLIIESPRWQMIRGKMDGVKSTFKAIARMNKLKITKEQIDALTEEQIRSKFDVQVQVEKETFKDIIGSKEIVMRLVVACVCLFTSSFLYYGLVVNCLFLPGDKYTNFILSSVASFPGDLIAFYTLDKFGRKITMQTGYIVSALFLIGQSYAPESLPWLAIALFLIGKLSVVVCFTSCFIYGMELFPTSVRGSLFGWASTISRIGCMLAPLTPLLSSTMHALPSILFATTSIVAAFALTFTPETKFLPLFDTIKQIEEYKTNEKKKSELSSTDF